jgi:hypothetical protein
VTEADAPPNPLIITPQATFTSSRQFSGYLLCVECEDKFRTLGEDWAVSQCYSGRGKFPLRDHVLEAKLVSEGPMGKFYAARSNPNINVAALTFFAASVFWRAAVRTWRLLKSGLPYRIALGPYEEQFREYLLGEAPFPPSAALWVWVARHETPSRAATPPDSHRVGQCRIHFFDVPGVRFF